MRLLVCLLIAGCVHPQQERSTPVIESSDSTHQARDLVFVAASRDMHNTPVGPGHFIDTVTGNLLLPTNKDCGRAIELVVRAFASKHGLTVLRKEQSPGRSLIHLKDERYPKGYIESLYRLFPREWSATVSFTLITFRGASEDPDSLYAKRDLENLETALAEAVTCH